MAPVNLTEKKTPDFIETVSYGVIRLKVCASVNDPSFTQIFDKRGNLTSLSFLDVDGEYISGSVTLIQ